jgi:hypothetical protein
MHRVGGYGPGMRTATRLAGFAAILAVVFGLGWGVGAAVGASDPPPTGGEPVATTVAGEPDDTSSRHEDPGSQDGHDGHEGHEGEPSTTAREAGQP